MNMKTESKDGIITNRFINDDGIEVQTQIVEITNKYIKYDSKKRKKEVREVKPNGEELIYKYSYPKSKNQRISIETYKNDEFLGTKITDYDNLRRKIYYKSEGPGIIDIEYQIVYHGDTDVMKKLYMLQNDEICSYTEYDEKGNEIALSTKKE